ncbi:[citrate (pro-3S)-lyase] ligase [Aliiruegeria lutimaris]|uniref:[Citrate [pro-3S]-lyase] ligase n=1 Tax=Aliiruegeria lutimaris TaxID=571298 RepID=A0A1G9ALK8_9RHOB|nr:[citrate (pro-3S)-lyase] ligase [Aliiruegeria lutimaris]SDK28197.1 [citrate (pro-3S)-lyase] ligase [Aliiruegeria lutimaris]
MEDLDFYTVEPDHEDAERREIKKLLGACDLLYEQGIETFVVCRDRDRLVACAGLQQNVIKGVAILPEYRGTALSLTLVSEITYLAHSHGYATLFVYTEPKNAEFFRGCGFYDLVEMPDTVVLMENTPIGIKSYCKQLQKHRVEGEKIGCVVANANPFTYGHRYLVEQAAKACDWLHLFMVREDVSLFSYQDRYYLAEENILGIPNLTLHPGSQYMVSRATFSCYFLKDQGIVGKCHTAVDLLMFRNHIAPALGITHRFVGTEPFCPTTNKYNSDMMVWLQDEVRGSGPAIKVVEIPRTEFNGTAISASEVRRHLYEGDLDSIRNLVPPATFELLKTKYVALVAQQG